MKEKECSCGCVPHSAGWITAPKEDTKPTYGVVVREGVEKQADAEFIVAARNALPSLLADAEAARVRGELLRECRAECGSRIPLGLWKRIDAEIGSNHGTGEGGGK